jgi:hypothetical protein
MPIRTPIAGALDARRKRRRPTGCGFALSDRIGCVEPANRDRAASGSSIFLGRPYLRALEAGAPPNPRSRYALVFRDDVPVAAVAAQDVSVDGSRWFDGAGGARIEAPARELGDRFSLLALRRGSEVLGWVGVIQDADTAAGYLVGFDRKADEEVPVCFRLLHAVIENAVTRGCRRPSLGRAAPAPTSRTGARPRPLHVRVRHRHPWLNPIVKGLAGAVPHAEAPERNPFKEIKTP